MCKCNDQVGMPLNSNFLYELSCIIACTHAKRISPRSNPFHVLTLCGSTLVCSRVMRRLILSMLISLTVAGSCVCSNMIIVVFQKIFKHLLV